jgi:hypothetical protein
MTNDSSRAVRWLVIIALQVATLVPDPMRANYRYGRIGQSRDARSVRVG